MSLSQRFDKTAKTFTDYTQAPWGRLRTEMILQQLSRHLQDGNLRILDIGAGNGAMAIPLAKAGHQVIATDFSVEMIAKGQECTTELGLTIEWLELDLFDLPQNIRQADFDLVLCHFVLPYIEDYQSALAIVAQMIRPNGYLSLMLTNPNGRLLKTLLRELKPTEVINLEIRPTFPNQLFGGFSYQHRFEQITAALENMNLQLEAYYGVRVFMDFIMENEPKYQADFYKDLLALEMAYCERDPFRQMAASTHYIAKKI